MSEERVEPELARQIEAALSEGRVEAIVMLADADNKVGANITRKVKALIKRAEDESGLVVCDFEIFKGLKTFIVDAPAALVQILVGYDEVRCAGAKNGKGIF